MHSKKKHISIKYHFLREKVTEQNVNMEYIGTKEHIFDIFIKPLPRETLKYLRQKLGVAPMPSNHYTSSKEAHAQGEMQKERKLLVSYMDIKE
jgi:hypothetical protein